MFRVNYKIVLALIASIYLLVSININFGKNKWQDVLESDAWGYYAYLPAVFIYHDLEFSFYEKVMNEGYFEPRLAYDYRVKIENHTSNKYFCGTALAISPFFAIAHFISAITNHPTDGYNRTYILMVNMAAIFYTVLGLFFLYRLLLFYVKNVSYALITILAFAFGTQLFYYSINEPGMSHVYSFCFINLFLWSSKSWIEFRKNFYLYIAFAALAMVFLIRPINMLIIFFIPFLSGSILQFKADAISYFSNKKLLIGSIICFLVIATIQPLIYYIQTGHWWIDSYPGENFNFLQPHITQSLFSFRKGLFIYTPLVFLAQLGMTHLYRTNKFNLVSYSLFFFLITYIISSWWIWYYGGGFSLRPFIEYFGIFAILLAILLENSSNKKLLIIGIILIVLLCQIQTYQYRYFIIHWSDMNFNSYLNTYKALFNLQY